MDNYQETLHFLFSQLPAYEKQGAVSYKPGLGNSLALDEYCGHPHRQYRCIHVAGTNGKGSVSHTLASVLQNQGYKVGLYTSPHILDFSERIRVNGQAIDSDSVVKFTQDIKDFASQLRCSFFELTSAMAFDYFAKQQVDIAIIEVGLGGRLDSTNIISPILSIITNISIDHTDLLGSTVAEIAKEKAGIIKPAVPVVIGQSNIESKPIFLQKATECNCQIQFADELFSAKQVSQTISNQTIEFVRQNKHFLLELDLQGNYQLHNSKTILTAIEVLREAGIEINQKSIEQGFANVQKQTGLCGRWQILQHEPLTICDTAHNEAGIAEVIDQLKTINNQQLHIVWSNVREKDLAHIINLLPKNAKYYIAELNMPRAMALNQMQDIFSQANLNFESFASIQLAKDQSFAVANKNDLIFIGGSTFTVAEILSNKV